MIKTILYINLIAVLILSTVTVYADSHLVSEETTPQPVNDPGNVDKQPMADPGNSQKKTKAEPGK